MEGPLVPRNVLLVVAYDGTAYSGWQVQTNAPTVQGEIEARLRRMTGLLCRLRGAGRTDAGVHAVGQVATFRTYSAIRQRALFRGINSLLPDDIAVREVREVPIRYNPRFHNFGKRYRYTLSNSRVPDPAMVARTLQVHRPLDLTAMAEATRLLVGTHDFAAFRAASCERETTVRTIFRCTVTSEPPLVHIDVEGSAFLKNMVRIIAGTLLEVGTGRRPPASLTELLAEGDRRKAGITAPARGLTMMRVFLDERMAR